VRSRRPPSGARSHLERPPCELRQAASGLLPLPKRATQLIIESVEPFSFDEVEPSLVESVKQLDDVAASADGFEHGAVFADVAAGKTNRPGDLCRGIGGGYRRRG
jgi:hypothetical protein